MRTGLAAAWLADHPHARRVSAVMTSVYALSLWSVVSAPNALASNGSAALNWTGLRDTYGVPIASYFLSVVSVPEAAMNNGVAVSLIDPSSWMPWMAAATERAVESATAAWWLTGLAGAFIFIVAAALWFVRFALSTGWLMAIATFAEPLFNSVNALVHNMMLASIAITICAIVAGFHMFNGNTGRGWAIIATALALTVLGMTVFRDPIGDLYSEHGLLALGRGTGFEIAQGATGASFGSGASLDAQLDGLMSRVVTAGVRQPLQLLNFGMVVDGIGGCGRAWSAAMMAADGVDGPGPAHAMAQCGAPQALAHAQRLGGSDATIAVAFVAVGIMVALVFWYVGLSVMLVGIKSLYFAILVGPVFLVGLAGFGRAASFAKHCAIELAMHVVQLMVFEVYLAVSTIALSWVLTTSAMGSATATTMPRVLLMGFIAALLWLGFRFIDHSFHADGIGTIGRQVRSVWSAGTGAVRQPYDDAGRYRDSARSLAARWQGRRDGQGDDPAAQADTPAANRAPRGVDLFKPRPSTRPASGTAPTAPATGPPQHQHGALARAAAGVVGTAARVAAPEAAAAALVADKAATSVGHVVHHQSSGASAAHRSSRQQPETPAPVHQPAGVGAQHNSDEQPLPEPRAQTPAMGPRRSSGPASGAQPREDQREQRGNLGAPAAHDSHNALDGAAQPGSARQQQRPPSRGDHR